MDVLYVRSEATADASLAAILERIRFGIAIAAMIRIIATTINNSINEKPCCFFILSSNLNHNVGRRIRGNRLAKYIERVIRSDAMPNSLIFIHSACFDQSRSFRIRLELKNSDGGSR